MPVLESGVSVWGPQTFGRLLSFAPLVTLGKATDEGVVLHDIRGHAAVVDVFLPGNTVPLSAEPFLEELPDFAEGWLSVHLSSSRHMALLKSLIASSR